MIANVKELEKALIDRDKNRKILADELNLTQTTLSAKIEKENADFKLSEMKRIAEILYLNERQFILIFLGSDTLEAAEQEVT